MMSLLREGGVAKEWPKVMGEGWGFCQKVTQNDDQCSKKCRREREDKPKSEIWRGCGQKVKIEKQKFVQISASNFDKKTIVWVCNLNSPHCTSVHRAIQPSTYYAKCNVICGQYPYKRWKWIFRSSCKYCNSYKRYNGTLRGIEGAMGTWWVPKRCNRNKRCNRILVNYFLFDSIGKLRLDGNLMN